MSELHHFAILAPVPLEHLESGLLVLDRQEFVAYGTMKWELLAKVDAMQGDGRIAVLIYPSHEDVPTKDSFVVSWFGWYAGSVHSLNGAHPNGMNNRPDTTAKYVADNSWPLGGILACHRAQATAEGEADLHRQDSRLQGRLAQGQPSSWARAGHAPRIAELRALTRERCSLF